MFGAGKTIRQLIEEMQIQRKSMEPLKTRMKMLESRVMALDAARLRDTESLSITLDAQRGSVDRLSAGVDAQRESVEQMSAQLKDLSAAANRHDLAVADMLDTWEEFQQSYAEESGAVREALSDRYRQEIRDRKRRESALLETIMAFQDQLCALRRSAKEAGDTAWEKQLTLAEEALSGKWTAAGLQIVAEREVPVNYDLHEVLGVTETGDPERAMRVADVYHCGFVYCGQVLRKAGVVAYQLAENRQNPPETAAEAEPEMTAEAVPETAAEAEPEMTAEAVPETAAKAEPDTAAEAVPETTEAEPDTAAEAVPDTAAEAVPETTEAEPETAAEAVQEIMDKPEAEEIPVKTADPAPPLPEGSDQVSRKKKKKKHRRKR